MQRSAFALVFATSAAILTFASTSALAAPASGGAPAPVAPAGGAKAAVSVGGAARAGGGAAGGADGPEAEWALRDKKLGEGVTLDGSVGLLHTQHAQMGAAGQFQVAFTSEFFSASFLCTSATPCKNPLGSGRVVKETMNHIGGHLSLSASITRWLEVYLSTVAIANSDDANRPSLLQVLGDGVLGVKFAGRLDKTRVIFMGGAVDLLLVNGTGGVGLEGKGTGGRLKGVGTVDLRELEKPVPLRFSLNGGYTFDNSASVVRDVEKARGTAVTRIERFGLGLNRVDHVDFSVGGEVFLLEERVRPFVEYGILLPTNRQDYKCDPKNPNFDGCLANTTVTPSKITLGTRVYPWRKGIGFLAALDVGVTGTSSFIEEVAPVAPWTLFIGAQLNTDTQERPPIVREVIVDKGAATRARFKGLVHEQGKPEGLANAIVRYDGREVTGMVTGTDGSFTTQELDAGPYAFTVSIDGYKPGACAGSLPRTSEVVAIDCPVVALPRVGVVRGVVRDVDTQAVVPNVAVKMIDAQGKALTVTADAQGVYRFADVAPGAVQLAVEAEGYLAQLQPVDVKAQKDAQVDVMLHKRPKNSLVTLGKKEISIKQQVQFETGSANILPVSDALLAELADVLIRNAQLKRVEVQGHTDNAGTPAGNQTLSEQRAEAVRGWLVQHGVPAERLVAKGFGQSKPIVPNVTVANKAKNRRVQFIITE